MSESLHKRLFDVGQKKLKSFDSNDLELFVEEINTKQMLNLILEHISETDAPQTLNYLLMGLSSNASLHKKRLKLCQGVLKEMQSKEITSRNIVALSSRIAMEVDKFSTSHLVSIIEQSVDLIRTSNNSFNSSWKELLPKALAVVIEKKEIDFAGAEMSGIEFHHRILQSLCGMQWDQNVITQLASMFIEMQLTAEEHLQVVNKLCSYLEKLPPQEIPPLVHQLLELCKDQQSVTVFLALQRYFASNVYNLEPNKKSENPTHGNTGSIEAVVPKEYLECENMVLYHIEESVKLSRGCVSEILKLAKISANCPEIILDPFLLVIYFTISSISVYETQVIEVLKSAIWRSVVEEEYKQNSAWLNQMISTKCSIEDKFAQLIVSKVCERDKVIKGLVSLSLALLGTTAAKGKEHMAESLWKIGRHALILLVKRQCQVAKTVLQSLIDRIITGQNVIQYTDCLNRICNSSSLIVLENLSIMTRLLDFLSQLTRPIAKRVITAALAIVRISNKLRDNLILVLRKALFSREIETRKISVIGFLQLLKCLKIKGFAALSQSQNSYSGPSIFTQICLDIHTQQPAVCNSSSNEAICLEVLGVLRRCFMQQASVKVCLYEGLYDALCKNPELCPSVLDILLDHFNQFYEADVSTLPPLLITEIIKINGFDVVLQEPIGKLLYVIQLIVVKTSDEMCETETPRSLEKFIEVLKSLVSRLIRCDIGHFDLDESTNLFDIVPESLQKKEMIYQILGVFEAMMAYIVNSWSLSSTIEHGQQLLSLYKGYSSFVEYVKNYKPGKKDVDGVPKRKGKSNDEKSLKKKSQHFKLPETILDFGSIHRILILLLSEDVPWATEESRADVKGRRVLHRYALQTAFEIVQRSKTQMAEWKSSIVLKPCLQLASLLYNQCLLKFNDISTFDLTVAVLSVECFTEILVLFVSHFKNNLPEIISELFSLPINTELGELLNPLMNIYMKLLTDVVEMDDEEDESSTKKLLHSLISGFSLLANQLPNNSSQIQKTLDWQSNFAQNRTLPHVQHTKNFVSVLFSLISRCKPESSLYDSLAVQLCHIFGTVNDINVEECPNIFKMFDESNKNSILPLLCLTLSNYLDKIDWLIIRLKAENAVFIHSKATSCSPQIYRTTCRWREKELVQHLSYCVNTAQSICCIAVSPGLCTEAVFKFLSHIFSTLTNLTKYFSSISSSQELIYQESRFGKVVKLAGTHLSDQISELILFVEDATMECKDKKGPIFLSHAKKQTTYIPKLVADLEIFSKSITLLSNKCKDKSLSTNVKLTTMRDFRLHAKTLELIMNKNNQSESDEEENIQVSQKTILCEQDQTSQKTQLTHKRLNEENSSQQAKKRRIITED